MESGVEASPVPLMPITLESTTAFPENVR